MIGDRLPRLDHQPDALSVTRARDACRKDVPRDQLIAGVRTVARGDALLAPAVTQRLIERFVRQPAPQTRPSGALKSLSARELDVLRLLAQGLSNEEIAQRLFISRATVKTHVASILQKLTLRDRIQAVVLAYECGLIRPASETEQAGVTGSK